MNAIDALRSRFRPEWKGRADMVGLDTMLENALSFVPAPAQKRNALAKDGKLSDRGIAETLRMDLQKGVVPALRHNKKAIADRRAAMKQEREGLVKPKTDPADVAALLIRQVRRAYLRGMGHAERISALWKSPDLMAAAMEAPDLAGLDASMRERLVEQYLEAHHGAQLEAMDDVAEALTIIEAATEIAIDAMRPHVGLQPQAFHGWFEGAAT